MVNELLADMEHLANMLAYRLPLKNRREGKRETCIRLKSLKGDMGAELVVRNGFVRMNLTRHPELDVLRVSGLKAKHCQDDRFVWATEVRPDNALGARLLLEAATKG